MTMLAVDLVIKGSLVLAVAALADVWLRRRASAASRHFAWTMAIAALLALPVAIAALPNWSITVSIPSSSPAAASESSNTAPVLSAPIDPGTVAIAPLTTTTRTGFPASSRTRFNPLLFAFALYSAGVVLLLARLATEHLALSRLTACADDVADPDWRALIAVHRWRNAPPPSWWDLASQIQANTLVLGAANSTLRQDRLEELSRRIPHGTFASMNANHDGHEARPSEFLTHVEPFIAWFAK